MRNPVNRNFESNSANPFGGWPNPRAIDGSLPVRPSDSKTAQYHDPFERNQQETILRDHPLVFCIGPTAIAAGRFALEEFTKEIAEKKRDAFFVMFGGQDSQLVTKQDKEWNFSPTQRLIGKADYQKWFRENVTRIVENLQELVDGSSRIIILCHLADGESGVLGGLLFSLEAFAQSKRLNVDLVVSPEKSDYSAKVALGPKNNPITSLREVDRYSWPGYFQQIGFPKNITDHVKPSRLVGNQFWIKSTDGSISSDKEQMGEYLSLLLIDNAEEFISQQLINGRAQTETLREHKGIPYLDEVRCASLYLPITEHKNYLSALMVQELLTGEGGVFSLVSHSSTAHNLYDQFVVFPEYAHPLYTWLLRGLDCTQPTVFPMVNEYDIDVYLEKFKQRLIAFINRQFLTKTSILVVESFLGLLFTRIQQSKLAFIKSSQASHLRIATEVEKMVNELTLIFMGWTERIKSDQEVENQFVPVGQQATAESNTFLKIITENQNKSLDVLKRLAQQKYSIPAIDGDIANDTTLPARVKEKLDIEHVQDSVGWWLVEKDRQTKLFLYVRERSFSLEDVELGKFWAALNDLLFLPINDLIMIDKAQFEYSLKSCYQKINVVNKPGLNTDDAPVIKSTHMLFTYSSELGRSFPPMALSENLRNIETYTDLPLTKVTVLIIDQGLPVNKLPFYTESIKGYLGNSQNVHLEPGERAAKDVERILYPKFKQEQLISPEMVFCTHEWERTRLFFKAFLAGVIHAIPNKLEPGIMWVIDPVEGFTVYNLIPGADNKKTIDSLFEAYHKFAIDLLPQRIVNQNLSPFHGFNWEKYKGAIQKATASKASDKSVFRALEPIFAQSQVNFTESQFKNHFDECFGKLLIEFEEKQQSRSLDTARLLYYHVDN